eukprot:TRINITY_DN30414_c0_g2_i1.p2 TRINITY_DN30414_c0_g2~~TRINITY_DN30414_c0_g2_i1.p2  ORF type:complete len:186 (-),score=73.11 TRINITY_DN30414_c0_g2_i1:16-573(-)
MDALALLSGEEDDDDEEPDEEDEEDAEGLTTAAAVDFASLAKAGYKNQSLSESDMYKRAGEQAEASNAAAAPPGGGQASGEDAASAEKRAREEEEAAADAERRQILEKAQLRDRKRAGVQDGESNRKKNARKMKMGQANFSLKDDRDCVNPFVDNSQAKHVQNYGGKRVDKHASVKQISNLSFTS